jgi:TonB family protein
MGGRAASERILRVGLVHGGRIVEERLLRKAGDVTVGLSSKCSFILPIQKPPESYLLFPYLNGKYFLRFTSAMVGRVSLDGRLLDLDEVKAQNLARREGDYYLLPLGPNDAGKIPFGEIRILFQMVAQPPAPARMPVPRDARGGPFSNVDKIYMVGVVLSMLAHVAIVGGAYWWWHASGQFEETSRRESLVYRVLKSEIRMKPLVEAEAVDAAAEGEGLAEADQGTGRGEEDTRDEQPVKRFTKTAGGGEETEEARYRRQVARVREGTLLKYLDGEGGGIRGLVGAEAADSGLAGAFNSSGGGTLVASDDYGYRGGRGRGGGGSGDGPGGGDTYQKMSDEDVKGRGSIKAGPVASASRTEERAVKIRIGGSLGEQSGPGSVSAASVESVFRRRRGAIQSCYERALKVNQAVEGKVSIRFTIGTAGTVTQISVVENSTGDTGVAQCIMDRVRGWPFPPPDGGLVIVTRHFLLMKSS